MKRKTLRERAAEYGREYSHLDYAAWSFEYGWLRGYRACQRDARKARKGKGEK